VTEWMKKHPYLTGSLVLVIVAFFMLRRRAAATRAIATSTGPSEALQARNLEASTTLQLAQISSASHASDIQAALAAKQLEVSGMLELGQAQKDIAIQDIVSKASIAVHSDDTQLQMLRDQLSAQVAISGMGAQLEHERIGVEDFRAGTERILATGQAQYLVSQGQAQLEGVKAARDIALDTNRIAVEIQNILAGKEITLGQLTAGTEFERESTRRLDIERGASVALSNISAGRDVSLATIEAGREIGLEKEETAKRISWEEEITKRLVSEHTAWRDVSISEHARDISATQEKTKQLGIETAGKVYGSAIVASQESDLAYIDAMKSIGLLHAGVEQQLVNMLAWGGFNKGGQGGANQVSVAGGLLHEPGIGTPSQMVESGRGPGPVLNGIANVIASIFGTGTTNQMVRT
jgi:hypothetical protein